MKDKKLNLFFNTFVVSLSVMSGIFLQSGKQALGTGLYICGVVFCLVDFLFGWVVVLGFFCCSLSFWGVSSLGLGWVFFCDVYFVV